MKENMEINHTKNIKQKKGIQKRHKKKKSIKKREQDEKYNKRGERKTGEQT